MKRVYLFAVFICVCLCLSFVLSAQTVSETASSSRIDLWTVAKRPDYTEIDKYVKGCGANCGNTPEEVADKVTAPCKSDIEKARAIFDWLAYTIAYDTSYS